jgi:AAA+ superfamily predicted ATPase
MASAAIGLLRGEQMTRIVLVGSNGTPLAELARSAHDILAAAEAHAKAHRLAKHTHFPVAVRQEIEASGYRVNERDLAAAMAQLESVRSGELVERVTVRVTGPGGEQRDGWKGEGGDMRGRPAIDQRFFEAERVYPDRAARAWYDRLVGLDEHKRHLLLELELLLYPDRLAEWSRRHHGCEIAACRIMAARAPLVLLEGDVGCGKTALAVTVGDALAQRVGGKVHLLKVNTQVRGTGMVGEMTELIVQAFTRAEALAERLNGAPVLLLIDEADALAAKRVDQHMHHEDKAGLNTLLQRLDGLRESGRRIAVIFITNRPDSLDPAVRRRSALRVTFARPDDESRVELFHRCVPELNLEEKQLKELATLTGSAAEEKYRSTFTYSDITDRLIPAAVRAAYEAGRPLAAADLIEQANVMQPTPLMSERNGDEG